MSYAANKSKTDLSKHSDLIDALHYAGDKEKTNLEIIRKLGNDERFELHFYGREQGVCEALKEFASGYLYFGFHKGKDGWYYREWAPAADKLLRAEVRWYECLIEAIR